MRSTGTAVCVDRRGSITSPHFGGRSAGCADPDPLCTRKSLAQYFAGPGLVREAAETRKTDVPLLSQCGDDALRCFALRRPQPRPEHEGWVPAPDLPLQRAKFDRFAGMPARILIAIRQKDVAPGGEEQPGWKESGEGTRVDAGLPEGI